MTRRSPPRQLKRHRHAAGGNTLAALLAIFALCLRLAWPAPPLATSPDLALAATLGEHALCLAAATGDDNAPSPRNQQPTGEHVDHDGLGCCLWHAAANAALPRIPTVAPIVFAERDIPRLGQGTAKLAARPSGPHQARAPPQTA